MQNTQQRFRALVGATLVALALGFSSAASAQQNYPSAEAASQAFFNAIVNSDEAALRTVLGADWKRFVPTSEIDKEDVYAFLEDWSKGHSIVADGNDRAYLGAGKDGWTLPIPIVKGPAGWHFDARAGQDLMETRRIGRNELAAMRAVMAYYDAQREYASVDRDNNGVLEYADKFGSAPGKHDGLYWATKPGEPESPLGPLYASVRPGEGYHGYHYKILKAQGPSAKGGAYSYVIGKRMRAGFALIAWPLQYGETGVMSFMVSHDGQLYQKNLGPRTDAIARETTRFDPGEGWQKVDAP
ncbi:DUF2950 domain-containing protein [Variovorax sp. OV329]|uniref:DUF2950 domain-containing protein n=1 Tax=Variovorax sp. OV329 TaxID=1882825 RepID=UPI0008E31906|nr:DUF2950 domain-containing protein [Variovorax sp. OV329]SFM82730.1 Protein of unknown function [Variovorax sp. OV329]